MDRWIGSGVLTALGLLALALTDSRDPRRRAAGGVVGLVDQVAWVVYGVVTAQYPFLASVPAYALVYLRVLRGARQRPAGAQRERTDGQSGRASGGQRPGRPSQGVYQESGSPSSETYLTDRVRVL